MVLTVQVRTILLSLKVTLMNVLFFSAFIVLNLQTSMNAPLLTHAMSMLTVPTTKVLLTVNVMLDFLEMETAAQVRFTTVKFLNHCYT